MSVSESRSKFIQTSQTREMADELHDAVTGDVAW
jgi:hypothetical protein